jgi:hypothetical protein
MTTTVDLTLPADSFPLGGLLDGGTRVVELERLVPLGESVVPFFWVAGGDGEDAEAVEAAVVDLPAVETVERLTTAGDRHLFGVAWSEDVGGVVPPLAATDGAVLGGAGREGRWELRLRLRFPTHDALRRFGDACRERGVRFDVAGVYGSRPPVVRDRLTPTQWETVTVAHDRGYFEVPRRATLGDLAEHFDVSEQAVSQRLRRALDALVGGVRTDSS